ncbi:MAG: glycosyltransferase, partial [Flavobacteriales bacterium]
GRYAKEKFSHQLFESFAQLPSQIIEEWELHAYGTGIEWEQRSIHPAIIHHGFVQPNKLKEEMTKGHAFVLPSIFEPWGVVVHEFAAAGFPMLVSNSVGAAEAFLEENKNGFLFDSGDSEKLKEGLIKLLSCSNVQLQQMGVQSKRLAQKITPETWSQTLLQIAQQSLH